MGSLVVAHKLSFSEACGVLVSLPGIEPTSPALQGRFLTTGLPEKSHGQTLLSPCLKVRTCEIQDVDIDTLPMITQLAENKTKILHQDSLPASFQKATGPVESHCSQVYQSDSF